jgi:hypothetical protein
MLRQSIERARLRGEQRRPVQLVLAVQQRFHAQQGRARRGEELVPLVALARLIRQQMRVLLRADSQ